MILMNFKNLSSWRYRLSPIGKIFRQWGLGILMVLALALPSQAHWADLAVADIQVLKNNVHISLTIPTGLVKQFDDDKNQQLSVVEINQHQVALQQFFNEKIQLTVSGQQSRMLVLKSSSTNSLPRNLRANSDAHSSLLLEYHWDAPVQQLEMKYELFVPGITTARCLTQIHHNNQTNNVVFTPTAPQATLINASLQQQLISFVGLGIEHIWTGYDHILFLISLLMLGGEIRSLLKVVTAFSIAHSFTLYLATCNVINVPSRWVEIAIALSIAYIAAENLWRKEPKARWQIAFFFGLIHGLGFSSALQELDLPRNNLLTSLASFSLGVEIGQFTIVLVAYFLLSYLRRFSGDLMIRRLISGGIIFMSLIWLWERAIGG
jgi:hydrogenase/urease accessory protein HupE